MVKPRGHEPVEGGAVRHAHQGTDWKRLFVRSRVAHTPIIAHSDLFWTTKNVTGTYGKPFRIPLRVVTRTIGKSSPPDAYEFA
jgi:hypothetical protein